MNSHERLKAWQHAHRLALEVYRSSGAWPRDERFGLTHQLHRAVVSVPANIAEGWARRRPRELQHFLTVALGSLAEVASLLRLAADLGYLLPDDVRRLEAIRSETSRTLWGLYARVKASNRK